MDAGEQTQRRMDSLEMNTSQGEAPGVIRDGQDDLLREIFYSPAAESGSTVEKRSPTTTEDVQYSFESSFGNEEGMDGAVAGTEEEAQVEEADEMQQETVPTGAEGDLEPDTRARDLTEGRAEDMAETRSMDEADGSTETVGQTGEANPPPRRPRQPEHRAAEGKGARRRHWIWQAQGFSNVPLSPRTRTRRATATMRRGRWTR